MSQKARSRLTRIILTDVYAFTHVAFAIIPAGVLIALSPLLYFGGPPLRPGELAELVLLMAALCAGCVLMAAIPLTIRLRKLLDILANQIAIKGVITSAPSPSLGTLKFYYSYSHAGQEYSACWFVWKNKVTAELSSQRDVTVLAHRTKPDRALLAELLI